MGGRAQCKGTDSSLFEAGSPACCQQALRPAPTPPSWLQALLDSSSWWLASTSPVGGGETGFPGLTEQWPGQLPLTHIPIWLLSKEIPSPVSSRWTYGSPLMCKHTCTNIPSPTTTHIYIITRAYVCAYYTYMSRIHTVSTAHTFPAVQRGCRPI